MKLNSLIPQSKGMRNLVAGLTALGILTGIADNTTRQIPKDSSLDDSILGKLESNKPELKIYEEKRDNIDLYTIFLVESNIAYHASRSIQDGKTNIILGTQYSPNPSEYKTRDVVLERKGDTIKKTDYLNATTPEDNETTREIDNKEFSDTEKRIEKLRSLDSLKR